jgi:uncharacterized protein
MKGAKMIDDVLIVDSVVHAGNLSESNIVDEMRPMSEPLLKAGYGLHAMLSPEDYTLRPDQLLRDWSSEDLEQVLFAESDVDVAVYHSLPLHDFFKDGLSDIKKGVEMKRRSPQRVDLHAAVNPLEGKKALDDVEYYIKELGASGIKIYPARFIAGQTVPIRLDDPEFGIPVIEKAIELGVKCISVHKYFPVGPTRLSAYNVDDVEIAGHFPEINFEVLHPGFAFTDETSWLLLRYPNVYVNLEWTISLIFRAPRRFAEVLGNLLLAGGDDRLFWASGAMLAHPQPVIDAFRNFEMPEDLMAGYGFPPLTDEAKRKIFGENWCRMHGIDVERLKNGVSEDGWAEKRAEGRQPAWSGLRSNKLEEAAP